MGIQQGAGNRVGAASQPAQLFLGHFLLLGTGKSSLPVADAKCHVLAGLKSGDRIVRSYPETGQVTIGIDSLNDRRIVEFFTKLSCLGGFQWCRTDDVTQFPLRMVDH